MRWLSLFTVLCLTWLLWSGHFEPLILKFGIISCALVAWLDMRMEKCAGLTAQNSFGLRWLGYAPWLIWQIIRSNFDVAKVILSPSLPIHPKVILVKSTQRTDWGQVAYANSITLTPGTVTLDVRQGWLLVHALTEDSANGLRTGEMGQLVTELEGPVS